MEIIEKLLDINKYSRSGNPIDKITKIVIHWVGNANSSAIANRNYFNGLRDRYASSHYIIGLDGEIIQCIPENEIAWHGNNENSNSIGIECCHPDWTGEFNDKTMKSLIELCKHLCKKYDLDPMKDIIRHYDCRGANHKCCPKYYVENSGSWDELKKMIAKESKPYKVNLDDLALLKKNGIITSSNDWMNEEFAKENISALIYKMANYIREHEVK